MIPNKLKFRQQTPAVNKVFIIDLLSEGELRTTNRRIEQVNDLLNEREGTFDFENDIHLREAKTGESLDRIFKELLSSKDKYLLIIEGHGSRKEGIILPCNAYYSWKSLKDNLYKITVNSGGDLTVVAAFCHSFLLAKEHSFEERLPFSYYYGFEHAINAGDLDDAVNITLRDIFINGNFGSLLNKNTSEKGIRSYSEYCHAMTPVITHLLLLSNPNQSSRIDRSLSINFISRKLGEDLAKAGFRTKGIRKFTSKAWNSFESIRSMLNKSMHDTIRKEKLLEDLKILHSNIIQGRS